MKNLLKKPSTYLYVVLVAVIFCGCKEPAITGSNYERVFNVKLEGLNAEFRIVVIDSCEYLYTGVGTTTKIVFHKGNCKFCSSRSKK